MGAVRPWQRRLASSGGGSSSNGSPLRYGTPVRDQKAITIKRRQMGVARRVDAIRKRRARRRAADGALAIVRTMFGDDDRLRLGQIEHLTSAMADACFRVEARAAHRAGRRIMIDDFVGISDLSQGLAFVTLLAARFLARTFAQAAHPRRFLQSIARRRFTAVRTVQSKLALKFGYPRFQSRDQRNQLFPRWLGWRIRVHRILESNPDSDVQKNLRARLRQTAYPTWAETNRFVWP